MFHAGGLRDEDVGREQVQLRPGGVTTGLQRIECGHACVGRVGFVFVRLLAFGPRVLLCDARRAASVHFPIHCVRESFRWVCASLGSGEGVHIDVHSPRGRRTVAVSGRRVSYF